MKDKAKKKNYLTAEGLAKIKSEYFGLRDKKRPIVVERLALARSQGDLSENNEYAAAREELAFVDGRIEELEEVIANSCISDAPKTNGHVCLGSKVKVKIDKNEVLYEIVGEFEADPSLKKVSANSPLGKALLGKKKGEEVEVEAPMGKVVFKILGIC